VYFRDYLLDSFQGDIFFSLLIRDCSYEGRFDRGKGSLLLVGATGFELVTH